MNIAISLSLWLAGGVFAADDTFFTPQPGNPPVNLRDKIIFGEQLIYEIRANGIPIGTIIGRVWNKPRQLRGREVAMFEIEMDLNDFASLFYPLTMQVKSYAALDTGASLLFSRRLREKKYRADDRVIFDYNYHNIIGANEPTMLVEKIQDNGAVLIETKKIPAAVCDPATLAWLLRAVPLDADHAAAIEVYDRYWETKIFFRVAQAETLNLPKFGEVDCWKIIAEFPSIPQVSVSGLWLEKNTRIIACARLRMAFGEISISLRDTKNSLLTRPKR